MEGFKNTTRMKTFGDVAPQAYAKGGSVKSAAKVGKVMGEFAEGKLHSGSKTGPKVTNKKQAIAIGISEAKKAGAKGPMKKNNGGEIVRMTDAERRASLEVPSRGMTPAEARALRATMAAKAAAPKRGPLIQPKNSNPMSPAEVRRLIEMDRPTNKMGAEAYKGGGKVGASKVPFAVKKVMRKAEGGAVNQIPEMPNQPAPPPPLVTSPSQTTPMPTLETMQGYRTSNPQANPSDIIRAQQAAEMIRLMGGTSPGPSPEMPQEPTPQSVFGSPAVAIPTSMGGMTDQYGTTKPTMPSGYGTSPGPMPTMQDEGLMPPPPKGVGIDPDLMRRISYQFTPEGRARTQAMLEASNRADAARAADQAATAQAQREMAAQAQMDRGLGLDLGGRRNNQVPMYGRSPYLPRS